MGYIEQSLGQDEKILFKARFHWLNYAVAWIELAFVLVVGAWIIVTSPATFLVVSLVVGCLVVLALLLGQMLPVWTTEIGVTNHRLIVKRGWLSRSTDEIQLRSIEQVNFEQGAFGRLLGYGRVDVHGTGVGNLLLPSIADPLTFVQAIDNAKGISNSVATTA
ncbi:MAG: PH domain-containing protein [Hyphomicrobiaceae bacterium]